MAENATRLLADALYAPCDPSIFNFKTTAELTPKDAIYGQDRAVEAVRFAIGMRREGFNLFAFGPEGSGKFSLVLRFIRGAAEQEPVPNDWCYVNNFAEPHKPNALRLPPGRGCKLRAGMEHLVDELKAAIPAAFETDEYRNRRGVIEEGLKEQHGERFNALQEEAQARGVTVIQTPMGLAVAPVKDDEVMSPKEFEKLPKEEKETLQAAIEDIQKKLEETLRQMPKLEREQREKLRQLNQEVTQYAVSFLIDDLKHHWQDLPEVLEFLEQVRSDVVENVVDFLPHAQEGREDGKMARRPGQDAENLRRYRVNLMVDNAKAPQAVRPGEPDQTFEAPAAGAPVVYEDHPTQPNLFGRVEHLSQFGTLMTDFNLIKPGALHRANGGYLVLDARRLLTQPFAWESLMRALRAASIRIETPAEALGWGSTITLEPESIPLDVKVILVGEPRLYYLLNQYDPDFGELFKVSADFDSIMDRSQENAINYADIVATLTQREGLLPLDPGGVGRIVEHGARLASDAEKLTAQISVIADVIREADHWAQADGSKVIEARHVQQAIDARIYRSDRLRARIQEEITRGTFVIDTAGAKVGQINGLSVLMLDQFSFGRPTRISCQVRLGRGEVIDIEREVALGGALHSKGVLILSSYLSGRFSREMPMSLSASLVFEQSYGGVDGDSASSAELYALLSALSDIPIKQSFAVTGSVDQYGNVQAIGGVNEKIEGFFDICKARGLTGEQGVLIPATNVKHLMLRADVVAAAAEGRFHIHSVETIDQGIALLTGVAAGTISADGSYPIGSVNRAVALGLERFAQRARSFMAPRDRQEPKTRGKTRGKTERAS